MKPVQTLVDELVELGPQVIGDCSIAVLRAIDEEALARAFEVIGRRYAAGVIDEQEARLFARMRWVAAALRAAMGPGRRS